jgi:hypothetical protein
MLLLRALVCGKRYGDGLAAELRQVDQYPRPRQKFERPARSGRGIAVNKQRLERRVSEPVGFGIKCGACNAVKHVKFHIRIIVWLALCKVISRQHHRQIYLKVTVPVRH